MKKLLLSLILGVSALAQGLPVSGPTGSLFWTHPAPNVTFIAAYSLTNQVATNLVPLATIDAGTNRSVSLAFIGNAPVGVYSLWVAARDGTNQSNWAGPVNFVWLPAPTGLAITKGP